MVDIGKANCKRYIVAGSRIQKNLVACVAEASGAWQVDLFFRRRRFWGRMTWRSQTVDTRL